MSTPKKREAPQSRCSSLRRRASGVKKNIAVLAPTHGVSLYILIAWNSR